MIHSTERLVRNAETERLVRNAEAKLLRALGNPGTPGQSQAFDPVSGFTLDQIVVYLREIESDLADAVLRRNGLT